MSEAKPTAAERYDDVWRRAYVRGKGSLNWRYLREEWIAAIEAAVAEEVAKERARCAAIARRRSNHSGLHSIQDVPWQIADAIERGD